MNEDAIIEAENLTVSFGTNPANRLFSGVSYRIKAGEHVALTGPSGCGKTTMLRCLVGLAEPTAGTIRICGEHLTAKSIWSLRGKMAFVPQEPDLGHGSAHGFLECPFKYRINAGKSENLKKAPELMDRLGLNQTLLNSDVGELSGGEKQRLALVAALLLERPILLLDEVVSALDDDNSKRVFELLAELKSTTIIGVVHDGIRMPFATREIRINAGGGNDCG
jgi:ABC-type lipoprotein export system ATPase subunit